MYNLGRRKGEGAFNRAVFSLQTYYLEICPVYLRVCTRANSEFTIDLSRRMRATGNKVRCGTTDCHHSRQTYFAKSVANCLCSRFRWHSRERRGEKVGEKGGVGCRGDLRMKFSSDFHL